ncbi:PaaI family thioesterase [Robertmurraya yapensis]|uniref:PaaI family thioesterase n=2 Tax=Bacillaceae TaxID=186817 RepID=A0A3S0KFW8_9BACI|nr:PaaI family thioesterase [Bacillus yapensis]RTR29948.1 PaaI family thioesterase [Bacillus yapensis]TKS95029.1 hotdog fold thioesterase [Bacillus yapensis]
MAESTLQQSPFWNYINMKEMVSKDGYGEVEISVFPDLLQRRGHVHGGVIATLVDASIGCAIRSLLKENEISATIELKTNYLRPAISAKLVGKAQIVQRGRSIAVGETKVWDEEGKLIAMGTATFNIKEKG